MIDDDTIYTLNDCAKRSLRHRHKASALWVLDNLWVSSVQPVWDDAWFEVKDCDGEGSHATSNRRVLRKRYQEFVDSMGDDLRIEEPAYLRWAFRREGHPLHKQAVGLVEAINALSDYPLASEDDCSELEYEWASAAAEEAFKEACEEAVNQECGSLKSYWDIDDFNFHQFKEEWIKDAMGREWSAFTKDGVSFPDDPHCRLVKYVAKVIQEWKDELHPDTNPCPLDAATALSRISELSSQTWISPRHTIEAWEVIVAIVMDIKVAL